MLLQKFTHRKAKDRIRSEVEQCAGAQGVVSWCVRVSVFADRIIATHLSYRCLLLMWWEVFIAYLNKNDHYCSSRQNWIELFETCIMLRISTSLEP
jgi:hypothetical protein